MAEDSSSNIVNQKVFTIPQTAVLCGVSRWTIRNQVTSGKLKASRTPGGHYRILGKDLESFIQENELFSLKHLAKKKVLIADDDPKIRTLLGSIFTIADYDVDYAFDGFETGKKVIQFRPDLVILDLIMPGMDGFEVCRRLKEDEDTRGIKVMAISGYDTEENKQRILDCGADLFLGKAFDIKELKNEVARLLA